jgi:hypothetical protein
MKGFTFEMILLSPASWRKDATSFDDGQELAASLFPSPSLFPSQASRLSERACEAEPEHLHLLTLFLCRVLVA